MERENIYKAGDVIASLYEVRKVFAGGMGEVYLAFHRDRKRFYALKTMQEKYFHSKEEFLAFRREAEVWIMLGKHPNLVQAVSVRDFEGRLFLVLEFIEPDSNGRNTLSDYLTGDPLPLEQTLVWGLQFCDGMVHARAKGMKCHRDVSPGNIMITKDLIVKITDFGLAKTAYSPEPVHSAGRGLGSAALGRYDITVAVGYARGKPAYMAPEAFTEYKNADEISDIYSFGVVFFQMLSGGERPFHPGVQSFKVYQHLHENSPVPELDNSLFPVARKCLAKERRARYQSFADLRVALETQYRNLVKTTPPPPLEIHLTAEDIRHHSQALFELKHYEDALKNCDKALAMDRQDYQAWDLRGRIYHALKRSDEALEAFDEAIRIKPDYYAPWNNKGILFHEKGETEEALSCFRRVISLRPDYREAWNNIGTILYMQGKLKEAVEHYREAVRRDRRYRDAWLNMGDCFIRLREYQEALQCYEVAVEVDPHHPYTLQNLEKLYQMLGLSDKAKTVGKKIEKGG